MTDPFQFKSALLHYMFQLLFIKVYVFWISKSARPVSVNAE